MALTIHHSPSPPPYHNSLYGNSHYSSSHVDGALAQAAPTRDTTEIARLCNYIKSCLESTEAHKAVARCERQQYDENQLRLIGLLELTPSDVMRIPSEIRLLPSTLKVKLLNYNDQDITPKLPELFEKLRQAGCKIGVLDLSACRLKALPPEVGNLTDLSSLELCGNTLSELPDTLTQLTSLHSLNLGANAFKSVPKAILQLPALRLLNLHDNAITEVPISLRGRISTPPSHFKWVKG